MRVATIFILMLVACTPPRRGDDGRAADAGDTGPSCTSDSDCEELGLVCDPVGGRCVCTRDSMCAGDPAQPWCLRSACSADECVSEVDCEDGLKCLGSPRRCVDGLGTCESCSGDECLAGSSCAEHPDFPGSGTFCAPSCEGGCPSGFVCRDQLCFRASGSCDAPGESCLPDSESACASDTDCSEGLVCDLFFGRCFAAQTVCEEGFACDAQSLTCIAACQGDDECPNGGRCSSGRCVGGDATSSTCASNEQCPLGTRCEIDPTTAEGSCVPGCQEDADCSLAAVCRDGVCQSQDGTGAQRCQVKEACGFRETCDGNACVEQASHCQSCSGGCGTGQCQPLYFSVVCGSGSALTCPGGSVKRCGNLGACTGCACEIQRCAYPCEAAADCPNGFYCANLGSTSLCLPVDSSMCS